MVTYSPFDMEFAGISASIGTAAFDRFHIFYVENVSVHHDTAWRERASGARLGLTCWNLSISKISNRRRQAVGHPRHCSANWILDVYPIPLWQELHVV